MKIAVLYFFIIVMTGCSLQNNSVVSDLKEEGFVYSLPYQKGKSYMLAQGYLSTLSHRGELALDFKMKKGTKICAARDGVVISTREDSKQGGYKMKYLSEGNHIIIRHEDGTYGNYWHLDFNGVDVSKGDTVIQGQVIGKSGNTGYSAFPHLHFEVTGQNSPGTGQISTRFHTKKGIIYLKPLRRYKSI